ncbi:helix-turn-helix domain-containing protein [Agathobaculum sp. NTUH-O15-33]|uniref:helix-turn-helix domain-containing protein n=1 Tax=Agathobaculum sp. NTUH-O15-33 TaxID=3079302 RepID=UPI002958513B|nr:helix-turn-helix domain-containing protein [Agathobaculum sp. NTUH-O15-33]WNX85810.1 helix-turn-helix domain-containing protein [Agathobaculum sp. NTUH-O15-33]
MDATIEAVSRLGSQNIAMKKISRRVGISEQKVRKILITLGQYSTSQSSNIQDMYARGMSIKEIASALNMAENTILSYLPYQKGAYNAEYPTKNALKIRRCREKKRLTQNKCDV